MRADLPSGTVTFLFTDVEGSTRLLHSLGAERYADALAEHRREIREVCALHDGVEVDMQGDAFFFAFPTAPGALSAAGEMTEALSSGQVQVRIGLHTGTPLLTDEGYVGGDVHRAARIAAAGHGGQVLISSSTAQLVEDELRDLGEHRFKDLGAPERVYQLGDSEFPALKSLYRTNLPVPATPFLGRERELAEVVALLTHESSRLLTLTGPGGTGKTRLAAQAAGLASDRYQDGVWWVPLAPLRDSTLVLETAAQVLGSKNGLAEHISDKSMLLLVDNFEQVVEAAPDLASLLASCPNLDLLVTSREPLHVTGEQEYPVPPFVHEEGVGFFLARAHAVKPDFTADEAVPEICRRLDQLPLALELASARVKALSSAQILERLEQRLPLLTGGARDAPERQRTLRATIEWSHELLTPEEQHLFARLSVFTGGCTIETAEEVCKADLDTLQSLVEKSLVRFTNERYWMLETIREFAGERLELSIESEVVRRRHADAFLRLAERAELGLRDSEDRWWLQAVEQELDNFRAALAWLRDAGDDDALLDLVGRIWMFWDIRGYWLEGRRWADSALERSGATRDLRRGKALTIAGIFARHAGAWREAEAYEQQGMAILRAVGDETSVAWGLSGLSVLAIERGDYAEAERLLEEAAVQAREAGSPGLLANLTGNRADLALRQGDDVRAAELAEEALALYRELGRGAGIGWSLYLVSLCRARAGRNEEAVAAAKEGLSVTQEVGDTETLAWLFVLLASIASSRGDAEVGGRLVGVADALGEPAGLVLTGVEAELRHRTEAELVLALKRDGYDATCGRGRAMSLDDAVAYALTEAHA